MDVHMDTKFDAKAASAMCLEVGFKLVLYESQYNNNNNSKFSMSHKWRKLVQKCVMMTFIDVDIHHRMVPL